MREGSSLETQSSHSKKSKGPNQLLLLFLIISVVFLVLIQALAGFQYPIYIEGVEFFLDVPDDEFSTIDIDPAITLLEQHNYSARSDDSPPGSRCPHSLLVSPLDTPGLRIWLKTECGSAVWGDAYFYGKMGYPVHNPSEVWDEERIPLIEERMSELPLLLSLSSQVEDIIFDDRDIELTHALLHYPCTAGLLIFTIAVSVALAIDYEVRRRQQQRTLTKKTKDEE